MKAVSPMIATILLIAFTVAVGAILNQWLSSTSNSLQGTTGAQANNVTKCAGASINIDSVSINNLTRFSNPSAQTVSSIQLIVTDGSTLWTITPQNTSLGPGLTAMANVYKGSNNSVTATGLCMSSVPVSSKCDNTMVCWTAT